MLSETPRVAVVCTVRSDFNTNEIIINPVAEEYFHNVITKEAASKDMDYY